MSAPPSAGRLLYASVQFAQFLLKLAKKSKLYEKSHHSFIAHRIKTPPIRFFCLLFEEKSHIVNRIIPPRILHAQTYTHSIFHFPRRIESNRIGSTDSAQMSVSYLHCLHVGLLISSTFGFIWNILTAYRFLASSLWRCGFWTAICWLGLCKYVISLI